MFLYVRYHSQKNTTETEWLFELTVVIYQTKRFGKTLNYSRVDIYRMGIFI